MVTEKEISNDEAFSIVPDGLRLPADVNFIPMPHKNTNGPGPASITAILCAAIKSIAKANTAGRIALYGAGSVSKAILSILKDEVVMVVNSDTSRHGIDFFGFTIESPQTLKTRIDEYDGSLDHAA